MKKQTIINLIHLNFIIGLLYAVYQFITTPRINLAPRRMWAYECWIIFGFYALFIFLSLRERQKTDQIIDLSKFFSKIKRS